MRTRLFDDSADRCSFPLDFGPIDPNDVDQAAIALSLDVTHDILGADLDGGVLDSELRDRTKPRCQVLAVRSLSRNIDSRLRTYNFCKSAGLRAGSITSSGGLEDCVSQDPRGSIASANLRLQRDIGGACVSRLVPLDDAFPGCGTSDASVLQACIAKSTACRVCLALNQADDLNVNCDLFDDGVANASCS